MNFVSALSQPPAFYAALAALAAVVAVLCLVQRLNFKALERHLLSRQAEADQSLESARQAIARLTSGLEELERASAVAAGAAPGGGLNLSKRSHALRMNRRGDNPDRIAAALNVPRQEVELLLKVHRIVVAGL